MPLDRVITSRLGGACSLAKQVGHFVHLNPSPPKPLIAKKPIRFDPLRRAAAALRPAIEKLTAFLREHHSSGYRRAHDRETFTLAVEAITCNLVAISKVKNAVLAVPRSNGVLRGGSAHARPRCYGLPFLDALDLLEDLGLIAIKSRGFRISEKARHPGTQGKPVPTTIVPTEHLRAFVPLGDAATWDMLMHDDLPETILRRPPRSTAADDEDAGDAYQETTWTKRWRSQVVKINGFIGSAAISLPDAAAHLADAGDMLRLVTPDCRSLIRVFNESSWSHGGRLYGGCWQTLSKEVRRDLLKIDGEPVAEVDFSAFNLRLAYARAGVPFPFGDDPDGGYSAATFGTRDGWKTATAALIGAKSRLKSWPGKTAVDRAKVRDQFPPGTKLADVVSVIKRKHSAIADQFERGLGTRFMRTESDILVAVLLKLMRMGIVALPIHDAVLCQERHAGTVKAVMEAEATRVLAEEGVKGTIPARIA